MSKVVRILGIDPGFRLTGYGLIDTNGRKSVYVSHGHIKTNVGADPAVRLKEIFTTLQALIADFQPDELAVEKVFVARNADSALKLGQARSAAICASFEAELPVYEYAATLVKQSIVGRGSADKEQVQHMVSALLESQQSFTLDESDALAIALCHAHTRALSALVAASGQVQ